MIFPNPVINRAKLTFNLQSESSIIISIYNVLGHKVHHNKYNNLQKGLNIIDINTTGFSSGIYFYRIDTGKNILTSKSFIIR